MLRIVLIRHFATWGNIEKRYLSVTDESLCEKGKKQLQEIDYPMVDAVFASPMKRCVETAKLIYPNKTPLLYEAFSECDFGDFEYKNFTELSQDLNYQLWIDSSGVEAFPNGENPMDFKKRCVRGFQDMIEESIKAKYKVVGLVVHGGTIMSILDHFSSPHMDYFDWQTGNGNGYLANLIEVSNIEKGWRLKEICSIH
jgi:alpha-ribazole phosphatase